MRRAELVDWWETAREQISTHLEKRTHELCLQVDATVLAMPKRALLTRRAFHKEQITPLLDQWKLDVVTELGKRLTASFDAVVSHTPQKEVDNAWSYGDIATATAAVAASVAPMASIPFVAGGVTTAGVTVLGVTFGGGAILAVPVAALGAGVVALAMGPKARGAAYTQLKKRYSNALCRQIKDQVLGSEGQAETTSLRSVFYRDLERAVRLQLEEINK